MTIKELQNIIKTYREQNPQSSEGLVTRDDVRARQLLIELTELNDRAYNLRKEKWFKEHPDRKVFEPTIEEVHRDTEFSEWFSYYVNRICMTPHERYHASLAIGDSEEEAQEEMNKTTLDILMDYKDYPDFEKVLNIWTEGR